MDITLKDFCSEYGLDVESTFTILKNCPDIAVEKPFFGGNEEAYFSDKYLEKVNELFANEINTVKLDHEESVRIKEEEKKKIEEEKKKIEEELAKKQAALSQILITSGYNFEGYKIVKYSGYISGDDAVQIPRSGVFGGNNGSNLTDALVRIRIQALKELKEAAYALGCNAVIGVDFDYITLEPETANIGGGTLYEPYVICVTANGTAVTIEKED